MLTQEKEVVAMRTVPARHIAVGASVLVMAAGAFTVLAAAGVGALSGIIPAIVAVRIRPIDAIRY